MVRLSIVIPIYNVEQYVERTLRSIIDQDAPKHAYEIIVVNDGSPDNSVSVVRQVMDGVPNIRLIEQENQGLSGARMTGMEAARGEYIWFVDSDDYITDGSIKRILNQAQDCDIITIGFKIIKNNQLYREYIPRKVEKGEEIFSSYYPQGAVFYIYCKSFLTNNNLKFIRGIYHEDFEFTPRVIYLSKKVHFVDYPVYMYMIREDSITLSVKPKRAFDLLKVARSLRDFADGHDNLSILSYNAFNELISLAVNNALDIITHSSKEEQEAWVQEWVIDSSLKFNMSHAKVKKYRIEGWLLRLIPSRFVIRLYNSLQLFNPNRKKYE